jgi:hypothetical protein
MSDEIIETEYGKIDKAALENLQDTFDTMDLLKVVDIIDKLRGKNESLYDLRTKVLSLHAMAHTIINDAEISITTDENILELADEIEWEIDEISELMDEFGDAKDIIHKVLELTPEFE